MGNKVELLVSLQVDGLNTSDPARQAARDDFVSFASDVADVDLVETLEAPTPGMKGSEALIILSSVSPAAVAASVKIMRMWLQRDRKRSINVVVTVDGTEVSKVSANGEKVSLASLERAIEVALERSQSSQ